MVRASRASAAALLACVVLGAATCTLAFSPSSTLVLPRSAPIAAQKLVSLRHSVRAASARSTLRMQEESKVEEGSVGVIASDGDAEEFFGVDANGNPVKLTLAAKEKLYLDATSAFHNDDKKMMGDDEYDQLKSDLAFEGSSVGLMSRDEIKFMVAANRYQEGKPIMSDEEFDALRRQLKQRGSPAVIHKVPTCRVETQRCKADIIPDDVKNLVLYMPAFGVVTILWSELAYWANTLSGGSSSPLYSLAVNTPFIVTFTWIVTNYILFQSPMVSKTTCPRCNTEQNVYFGDILFVNGGTNAESLTTECVNSACRAELKADKIKMIVECDMEKA